MKRLKTVGYTTGVFDLFHIGHLHLLKKSKRHCDYLIVGVSTDQLVNEYKGKLPIIPLEDRLEIISSLSCVDEVVIQSHRDKKKQYDELQYDLLFVGDDWRGNPIFNELEQYLNLHGSELMFFKYTNSVSSTKYTKILHSIYSEI